MLKLLLALFFLPSAVLLCAEAIRIFFAVALEYRASLHFMAGFAIYAAAHFFLARFIRLYVLAHELTHAAAALLCGFKVKDMSVGSEGGYVTLSGSNAFVSLAPYCVPLYVFMSGGLYWLLALKWDISAYRWVFVGAVGFFMAFHLIHTFETIYHDKQSDLRKAGGVVFSVAVILLCNSAVMLIVLKLLYGSFVNLHGAAAAVYERSFIFWRAFRGYLVKAFYFIGDYAKNRVLVPGK